MTSPRALVALLVLVGCGDPTTLTNTSDAGAVDVARDVQGADVTVAAPTYTPTGAPPWSVRCAQTTTPAPTDARGYLLAVGRFLARAVSPEHRASAPTYVIDQGQAHAGPYLDEPERFLSRADAPPRAIFTRPEVDDTGTHFVLCVVSANPDAARGRTPDGADVSMIANDRFPLTVAKEYRLAADVIGADVEPIPSPAGPAFQGNSHVLLRWAQQFAFEPTDRFPIASEFRATFTDTRGEGYRVVVPFLILDSPP